MPASTPPHRPDDHGDGPPASSRYQRLDHGAVRASADALAQRVARRFPDRSLGEVAGEVVGLIDEVGRGSGISRRRVRLARLTSRLGMVAVVLVIGGAIFLAALDVLGDPDALGPVDWLPLIETVINQVVFGAIAVFFLHAVPERMERSRVLRILHRLRSLAHVIDMHQVTKVPERLEQGMSREDLTRYLEYATEMLSLVGKAAALFAEDTTDGEILDAVGGIESLTSDMARKVWQKIAILQA